MIMRTWRLLVDRALIKNIADTLNIDISSEYTVLDMWEEIEKISDIVSYKRYLKDNIDHLDTAYKNGFQKFLVLTKKYLRSEKLELNKEILKKGADFIYILCKKVKELRQYQDRIDLNVNAELVLKTFNKEPYFSLKEQNALNAIGSVAYCIKLQRSVSGADMLEERLHDNMIKNIMSVVNVKKLESVKVDIKRIR